MVRVGKPRPPRAARRIVLTVLAVGVVLSLGACENLLLALFGAPTNLEASDGTSATVITVTWDEVSTDDDVSLDRYELQRDGGSAIDVGTSTSYSDTGPFTIAQLYTYRVRAVYSDATISPYSASDTGYVMDATSALVHHVPFTYSYAVSNEWLTFPAQAGWNYRIYVAGGVTVMRLLESGSLAAATAPGGGAPSVQSDSFGSYVRFRTNASKEYHLEVSGSGQVSVVHE